MCVDSPDKCPGRQNSIQDCLNYEILFIKGKPSFHTFILQFLLLNVILNINVINSAYPIKKQISMTAQVIPIRTPYLTCTDRANRFNCYCALGFKGDSLKTYRFLNFFEAKIYFDTMAKYTFLESFKTKKSMEKILLCPRTVLQPDTY